MPLSDAESKRWLHRLERLSAGSPDVEGVALITVDGLLVSSTFPGEIVGDQLDLIVASLAAAVSLAANLLAYVKKQALGLVIINGAHGYVIVMPIFSEMVLVVLAKEGARLGSLFLNMRGNLDSPFSPVPEPVDPPRPLKGQGAMAKLSYDDSE